jgi:hypothetical protein
VFLVKSSPKNQPSEVEEALLRLHHTVSVDDFRIVSNVYTEELEAFYLLHCCPVNVDRGVLPLLFPEVHDQRLRFIVVEGEVIFPVLLRQGPEHLPVYV